MRWGGCGQEDRRQEYLSPTGPPSFQKVIQYAGVLLSDSAQCLLSVLTGEAGPRQEGRKRGSREGSKQDQGATSEWDTGASAQGLLPVSPGAGPSTLHSYRPAWGWGCWQASEGRHPPQGPSPPSMEVQVAAPGSTRGGLPCVPSRRPWKLCSSQEFLQVTQEGHRDGSCPPSPCNVTGLLMRAANHPEIKEPMSGEAGSQEPLGLKSAP